MLSFVSHSQTRNINMKMVIAVYRRRLSGEKKQKVINEGRRLKIEQIILPKYNKN